MIAIIITCVASACSVAMVLYAWLLSGPARKARSLDAKCKACVHRRWEHEEHHGRCVACAIEWLSLHGPDDQGYVCNAFCATDEDRVFNELTE